MIKNTEVREADILEKSSLSEYGITIVSIIVTIILLLASQSITTQSIKNAESVAVSELDEMNDYSETAIYNPNDYGTITIYSSFEGTDKTETYTVNVKIGEKYYIKAKEYEKYTPSRPYISGVLTQEKTSFNIFYAKNT